MAKRWSRWSAERILLGMRRYFGSAWACFVHLVLYPLLRPQKTNQFCSGVLGLKDELDYASSVIPAVEVWQIFPGIEGIDTSLGRLLPDEGSSISFREMVILCSIVRHEQATRVFEIGTSLGVTAYNLARNLPEEGLLYTLDLPPVKGGESEIGTVFHESVSDRKMIYADRKRPRFVSTDVEKKIRRLYGDSATFDYGPFRGICDAVFIDGSHAFDYVRVDTIAAFKIVKPGGLVIWHDYTDGCFCPDVHRYLIHVGRRQPVQRIRGTRFAIARAPEGNPSLEVAPQSDEARS